MIITEKEFYTAIIGMEFVLAFVILVLISIKNLKVNVKTLGIIFLLFGTGVLLSAVKLSYQPDTMDYFLLGVIGMGLLLKIIERIYVGDNKIDKIFEEEKRWKEETFSRKSKKKD